MPDTRTQSTEHRTKRGAIYATKAGFKLSARNRDGGWPAKAVPFQQNLRYMWNWTLIVVSTSTGSLFKM